jgi:hypothetical protein
VYALPTIEGGAGTAGPGSAFPHREEVGMAKKTLEPFWFHSGEQATNLTELRTLCRKYPEEAVYHLNEGHFEEWLKYINKPDNLPKVREYIRKVA